MVSDRLSARRNGLTAASRSGYLQLFSFHPSNTFSLVCHKQIINKTLVGGHISRIKEHTLRSFYWSEGQSFVNSQNKTSRYHPVRRHPTSTGDASPASCQRSDWSSRPTLDLFLLSIGQAYVAAVTAKGVRWLKCPSVKPQINFFYYLQLERKVKI